MEIEFNSLVVFFVLCLRGNLSNGFGRMSGTPEEQEVVRRLQAVQHQLA